MHCLHWIRKLNRQARQRKGWSCRLQIEDGSSFGATTYRERWHEHLRWFRSMGSVMHELVERHPETVIFLGKPHVEGNGVTWATYQHNQAVLVITRKQ